MKIKIDGYGGKIPSLVMWVLTETGVELTTYPPLSTAIEAMIADAVKAEQDRCCKIIYGMCSSDVTAERTVKAIRSGKGDYILDIGLAQPDNPTRQAGVSHGVTSKEVRRG